MENTKISSSIIMDSAFVADFPIISPKKYTESIRFQSQNRAGITRKSIRCLSFH